MDEGRRLQRMVHALPPQIGARAPTQFLIDEWDQIVARANLAAAPCLEQKAHLAW
jgi:hypothetical protein